MSFSFASARERLSIFLFFAVATKNALKTL